MSDPKQPRGEAAILEDALASLEDAARQLADLADSWAQTRTPGMMRQQAKDFAAVIGHKHGELVRELTSRKAGKPVHGKGDHK